MTPGRLAQAASEVWSIWEDANREADAHTSVGIYGYVDERFVFLKRFPEWLAPLLAEERRAGAEKGWDDGWSARKMLGDALPLSENPYRAGRTAQQP